MLLILIAVKAEIFPEPEIGKPIDELMLVQLKIVPFTAPLKVMGDEAEPEQIVTLLMLSTLGKITFK